MIFIFIFRCSCEQCSTMPTELEDVCCHHYSQTRVRMGLTDKPRHERSRDLTRLEAPVQCITSHPGFHDICLSQWTLEYEAYQYVEQEGRVGDDQPINVLMRHLAYRRFVRWVFGKIGRHNRITIPSCVVNKIRNTYASDVYVGFRFPVYWSQPFLRSLITAFSTKCHSVVFAYRIRNVYCQICLLFVVWYKLYMQSDVKKEKLNILCLCIFCE